jgi:hypothetical protein
MQECTSKFATTYEIIQDSINELKRTFDEMSSLKTDEKVEVKSDEYRDLLTCPITHEVMVYPVTISCGHTFERHAIMNALKTSAHCPVCRDGVDIPPFMNLKSSIILEQLIDKMYSGYRHTKRSTNEIYKTPTGLKRTHEQRALEESKGAIKRALEIFDELLVSMAKVGCGNVAPNGNPSRLKKYGTWYELLDLIQGNKFVQQEITKYLDQHGLVMTMHYNGTVNPPRYERVTIKRK